MDQTENQGIRLRHSKEDKKKHRKKRKQRKQAKEGSLPYTVPHKASSRSKPCAVPNSRGRAVVNLAVKRNRRSTFLTPTLRSAVLQTTQRNSNSHWPSSSVPELNRTMLSSPSDKGVVLGEGTYGLTRFMHFNGNFPVAVKEFKGNDIYEVNKEAELQRRYHPNLPYILGICVKEKPYLMITQFYGKRTKSYSLSK